MSLKTEQLSAGYKNREVIRKITLSAEPGELIALLGPNGSGKTTLIKTLTALLMPYQGHVTLNGQDLQSLPLRLRAREIAYLPQGRVAMPQMSVQDILELGRAPFRGRLGKISSQGQSAIETALAQTQLQDYRHRPYGELSGGEQARVLLARTLCVDAPVIIADEPIAALDPYYQISTLEILKRQAMDGKIVIVALHDLRLAAKYADKAWVMKGGEIFRDGPSSEVMDQDMLETVFRISSLI